MTVKSRTVSPGTHRAYFLLSPGASPLVLRHPSPCSPAPTCSSLCPYVGPSLVSFRTSCDPSAEVEEADPAVAEEAEEAEEASSVAEEASSVAVSRTSLVPLRGPQGTVQGRTPSSPTVAARTTAGGRSASEMPPSATNVGVDC